MPARDVADFVRDHDALLVLAQHGERTGVDDNKRPIESDCARVHERRERHVQIRHWRHVEHLTHLAEHVVQLRMLRWSGAHRIGEKEMAQASLAEKANDFSDDFIKARQ